MRPYLGLDNYFERGCLDIEVTIKCMRRQGVISVQKGRAGARPGCTFQGGVAASFINVDMSFHPIFSLSLNFVLDLPYLRNRAS